MSTLNFDQNRSKNISLSRTLTWTVRVEGALDNVNEMLFEQGDF